MCVCVCACGVRARALACAHMMGLDETTKETKHLEAISTFSPVGSRSSDGMKMRTYERERARVYGINLKLISIHYCNIGMSIY